MHIDRVIRTRRKTIALIIQRDGSLMVRAPLQASSHQIQVLVDRKVEWIEEKRAAAIKQQSNRFSHSFREDEEFLFLGKGYPLMIVEQAAVALSLDDHFRLNKKVLPKARQVFTSWFCQQARQTLAERVAEYARRYGFSYKQVKITSAVTRWGSCSSSGSLNFTWRLVMAPLDVIDYVVVHELVHTRVKNHSKDFWAEVKAIMPDYQARMEWLKRNGSRLKLD
jgi:predicted metal-dependent hydrolase